jgi:orotate phosphoribosyltransferase
MIETTSPLRGAASEIATSLLNIGAVGIRPNEPFSFTSGWASPVYIDCRRVISYPVERTAIITRAVDILQKAQVLADVDAVAGGETAGIPYAAWLSQALDLPMLYVRKKPKGFGRNARIEGHLRDNSRVLLVEDLATDGASKVSFADALRDAGATVTDAFVVFFYGIFPAALNALETHGICLHYLATWWDVIEAAEASAYAPAEDLAEVRRFLTDPVGWSAKHGGRAEY